MSPGFSAPLLFFEKRRTLGLLSLDRKLAFALKAACATDAGSENQYAGSFLAVHRQPCQGNRAHVCPESLAQSMPNACASVCEMFDVCTFWMSSLCRKIGSPHKQQGRDYNSSQSQ